MHPFTLQRAVTQREALAAAAGGGRYIAGGTTLVDLMREEVERPAHLIDINALPLRAIGMDGDTVFIGALARMAEVAAHPAVQARHPLVAEALVEGASPQLRNMASIGGNLMQRVRCPYFRMLDAACNKRTPGSGCAALGGIAHGHAVLGTSAQCIAVHPSDLAVALVALDAVMIVHGPRGVRQFPVEALYRLPSETPHLEHTLRPGELITAVRIPPAPAGARARYLKVPDRASYEFALVSAAATLRVEDGRITAVRLACGGVGTRPWRMRRVEAALLGQPATRASFEAAAARSVDGARAVAGTRFKLKLLPRTIVRAFEMVGEAA